MNVLCRQAGDKASFGVSAFSASISAKCVECGGDDRDKRWQTTKQVATEEVPEAFPAGRARGESA